MRSHPVVGCLFLFLGVALAAGGLLGNWSPAALAKLPLPASIVIPFILWQLAVWSILFGIFFLRPRGRPRTPRGKTAL